MESRINENLHDRLSGSCRQTRQVSVVVVIMSTGFLSACQTGSRQETSLILWRCFRCGCDAASLSAQFHCKKLIHKLFSQSRNVGKTMWIKCGNPSSHRSLNKPDILVCFYLCLSSNDELELLLLDDRMYYNQIESSASFPLWANKLKQAFPF